MVNSNLNSNAEPHTLSSPSDLLDTLRSLRETVNQDGLDMFNQWRSHIHRREFLPSALNLAHYLVLRRHDLRSLQTALMPWGLSSLGRIEARVMPNLDAVIATLSQLCGHYNLKLQHPPLGAFFEGQHLLLQHTEELFGQTQPHRRVKIMVTLPPEAASNYQLVKAMVQRGANCARINCAHDSLTAWGQMIAHVHQAEAETGNRCTIMMDLGGPKIRTGPVRTPSDKKRLFRGDTFVLSRCTPEAMSQPETLPASSHPLQTCCSVPEVLDLLEVGAPIYIDDGKLRTTVIDTHYPDVQGRPGLLLQVTHARPKGVKLRPEKGLNFPHTVLPLAPLTNKDLQDLDFVVTQADIIGYSFVQLPADIELLQQAIAQRLGNGPKPPAIVAKIETAVAVTNLPELIIHAAGKQPFGVMIARGDLAVEIGYQRLAEIQEEILWLCESAHVPVIWATQVLESLVKEGAPSRGEMTDAAMAERAECVMLNKGPFIVEAITILDDVLTRMEAHQLKKTSQLRALSAWAE
ncbi:pyruvate kinase [Nodosilinea sp. P-1105]|uniref:pyruvate kinase n=1 Tax=Nodosilinea sp. P-1105 TaxID=2546229 RepID=UPI00146E62E1|nr:pyruvate kinase [Nodosilinea sp. P-1105]NMF84800.1 hypothetical protein [Nodosilinea sp. P-1105]